MCQFETGLYPTENVSWCLYTLVVNDTERIKKNCNCEVKLQTHNVLYHFNRKLWAIIALDTKNYRYGVHRKTTMSMLKLYFNSYFSQMNVKPMVGISIFPLSSIGKE